MAEAEKPKNIVFILADDLGWMDLGCYGSTFYETPNLDRLASEGARFTQAYAACPVCSPTRASILTGKWPQRIGITDYIGAPQPETWKRPTQMLPAPYKTELALEEITIAEVLKEKGYNTFFAGKWHLGPEGRWPEDQGFDINQGGIDRGGPYGGKQYFSPYGNPRLADGPEGEHLPDRLARETTTFIDKHRDEPFFAYLSFYSVHTPLIAREDLKQKYVEKRERLGLEPKWGQERGDRVRLVQEHAVYAAMIEAMDLAVGKVLAKLDELDLANSTLVIFTSDNGGLSTSEGLPTSNLPLRAGKGWLYEGGIREPLLIRWPGVTEPDSTCDALVSSPDFFQTLIDAANISSGDETPSDGVSLRTFLTEEASGRDRTIFWHYPHYGNQRGSPGAAIRDGEWKLINWFEDDTPELFNLTNDLGEHQNLAEQHPERVTQLQAKLKTWQDDVAAKFPTLRPE